MRRVVRSIVLWSFLLPCRWLFPLGVCQTLPANAERARAVLREGIEAGNADIRIQAVIAVSMIGQNEAVLGRLERCLQDKDVEVRLAAVRALADLKSPRSKPALEKSLKEDSVPEVAFAAANALYALQDPAGRKALVDVYDGKINPSSKFMRKESRSLIRNFHSVGSSVMFIVGQGMNYVPVPGAGAGFSAMMELANDPDMSPRAGVILLLGKEKNSESSNLLRRALTDGDWSVRAAAAQIIANTARIDLRDSLPPLFEDKKEKVRFRASGAYLRLSLREK